MDKAKHVGYIVMTVEVTNGIPDINTTTFSINERKDAYEYYNNYIQYYIDYGALIKENESVCLSNIQSRTLALENRVVTVYIEKLYV